MRILLINVDCDFNLAIRKYYRYFLERGDEVEMRDLGFTGYPHKKTATIDCSEYDKVFCSNVFEVNKDRVIFTNCKEAEFGGVGSRNTENRLPEEVEKLQPWYAEDETTAWGFVTRGCIRNCYFCKVPKHEGYIRGYNSLSDIIMPQHKRLVLMDNNILAYDKHVEVLADLAMRGIKVQFNQGLDERLINEENAFWLSQLNYDGPYTFAFDDYKYKDLIEKKFPIIRKEIPTDWKIRFFVYIHPKMENYEIVARILWCLERKCVPYIMRDAECYASEKKNWYTDLAAWVNQPGFVKNMEFEDFLRIRHKNAKRIEDSAAEYEKGLRDCALYCRKTST